MLYSIDEDVMSHQKAKKDKKNSGMVDVPVHNQNWSTDFVESDFSDDVIDNDDGERMVANSTDDEDSEMRFPRFNEATYMANPQFEIDKGPTPTAPRPNKKKKTKMPPQVPPQMPPNDHSQGGIFDSVSQSSKPTNTMKQLQRARNEKLEALKKKKDWKL
ncbi:hypothetical protein POM88_008833 [Heracleum sosnowskyi]|uniref:Uncharacterized protein n=1 Tax=Heracleum sosnowskyi TaxID=360622 RepID=A0AAD8N219_9APIA|nr:hypothetical protein POM88_008833 [Heracleum sosnowskyi]